MAIFVNALGNAQLMSDQPCWAKTIGNSKIMKLLVQSLFSMLITICMTACANIVPPSNLKAPDVGFSDLAISDIGLSNIKFVVTVAADNKNDIDVPLSDMKFDLAIMGNSFATGVAKEANLVLPKNGSKSVPIEFSVPTSKLINLVKTSLTKETTDLSQFNYVLKGTAKWGTGPFNVPFERKGDLSALKSLADLLKTIVN
jgi:LEA14-like dessication related protein